MDDKQGRSAKNRVVITSGCGCKVVLDGQGRLVRAYACAEHERKMKGGRS